MKYSLFTVSVPELTPEQALIRMKECGYDSVDWRVAAIPNDPDILKEEPSYWRNNRCTFDVETIDQKAEEIKALCHQYGLHINMLCTYLTCRDSEESIERCMKAAKKMDCARIRINAPSYDFKRTYGDLFDEAVEGFKKVEALAKKHGVKADFEMHMRTIVPSASAAFRLASRFDPAYIGVIYDTGNVVYEGFEEYQMALEILGPYLDLVHVKNARWVKKEMEGKEKFVPDWAPFADGYADFEKTFQALKKIGYDGVITFEDFSSAENLEEKIKNDICYIRGIVEALNQKKQD